MRENTGMANNYIRPLLAVYQQLEITLAETGDHLHACVIGPSYDLHRFGIEDVDPHKFTSDEQEIPFKDYHEGSVNDYVVDTKTVNVYAEGLEANLADIANKMSVDAGNLMVLRINDPDTNGYLYVTKEDAGHALAPEFHGLGVSIGDIVHIASSTGDGAPPVRTCRVVDVVGAETVIDSVCKEIVSDHSGEEGHAKAGVNVLIGTHSAYNGDKDSTVYAQVTSVNTASHKLTLAVSDSAGVLGMYAVTREVADYTNTDDVDLGAGLKAKFTGNATYSVGDVIVFNAYKNAVSEDYFDGILLDAAPIDASQWSTYKTGGTALASVGFRKEFYGDLDATGASGDPWYISVDSITGRPKVVVNAGLSLFLEGRDAGYPAQFVDGVGNLYVSFRELVQADPNEDIFYIASEADIKEHFGTIAQENELAYAAYWCLKGSQGRPIYALRTRGTDVASFHAAIEKTEAMTETYSVAVVSDSYDVIADIVAFNDKLSQPEVKRWRRTLCGVDFPGTYEVARTDLKQRLLTAKIVPYSTADGAPNVLLQMTEGLDFDLKNVKYNGALMTLKAGDKVVVNNVNEYTIKTVLSSTELLLVSGPRTQVSTSPVSFWKPDTADNNVDYIGSVASSFNSRRVTVVWCDGGVLAGSSDVVENKFVAAEVAGISSAVVPQAGITRTEVQSITNAVKMYTKYRQEQLDAIASNGVMIITQDGRKSPCYIRHQLTTEMDKGPLYYEESPTRNLDNISYGLVDVLEGFIGKANVTPSALLAIEAAVISKLNDYTQDSPDPLIGPSLVKWDSLKVVQDPDFKDRVIIKVNLYLPLPLNGIRLYEMAYAATVTI